MTGMPKSIINRKYVMSTTFTKYGVHEVYSDVAYTLDCDNPAIVILVKNNDNVVEIHREVTSVYPQIKSCTITSNPRHPALQGKKIVYRDGVWYV